MSNLKYFSEAGSAGERIMEVIKRVPKIDSDNTEGQILGDVLGEVEFKHVEFAYPSRPESIIFKDFSAKIPAGRTVALVGGSGSGKSTVISLLQRFYDPLGGEILLDGVAIDKLQLKWLRSQMGLVSQEPALFATSIKENILFGKEDAGTEEVIEAAKASNAHNFISQLPLKYDTQVSLTNKSSLYCIAFSSINTHDCQRFRANLLFFLFCIYIFCLSCYLILIMIWSPTFQRLRLSIFQSCKLAFLNGTNSMHRNGLNYLQSNTTLNSVVYSFFLSQYFPCDALCILNFER